MKRIAFVFLLLLPACGRIPGLAKPSYPYPECPVVVDYITKNANDPASVEIVEWTGREVIDIQPGKFPPVIDISVKVRGKNAFGALTVDVTTYEVREGKVIGSFKP